jgi:VIT1/CCC1 family predicted Fe2+/Mn2+ transporter
MNQTPESAPENSVTPSRRDRLRPLEFIGFATVLGVFAGLIVLMGTRDLVLAAVSVGIAFIATVIMVALVGLGKKPSQEDIEARGDLRKPEDGTNWH